MRGLVKWWNDEKGYGFLSADGAGDIFVHYSNIQMPGRKSLTEGAQVEFEVEPAEKGPRAKNVVVIG